MGKSQYSVRGRLKVRNIKMVNRTLHKIAIEAIIRGRQANTGASMKLKRDWPAVGVLSWKEERKEGMQYKRLRGKQKPPKEREQRLSGKKQCTETCRGCNCEDAREAETFSPVH